MWMIFFAYGVVIMVIISCNTFYPFHPSMAFNLEIGRADLNVLSLPIQLISTSQHLKVSFSVQYTSVSIAPDSKGDYINHTITV